MSDFFYTHFLQLISVVAVVNSQQVTISPKPAWVEINTAIRFNCNITVQTTWRSLDVFLDSRQVVALLTFYKYESVCAYNAPPSFKPKCNLTTGQFWFTIEKILGTDHGHSVICKAQYGSSATFFNDSSLVNVKVPLTSIKLLSNANADVKKDEIKVFSCETNSRPATNITWKKINKDAALTTLDSNQWSTVGITVKSNMNYTGNISDNGAKIYCQGQYYNKTIHSENITVQILYRPNVTISPNLAQYSFVENTTKLELNCTVTSANPAPTFYSWYKDGSPINDLSTATYTITIVRRSHRGNYTCDATNSVGRSDKSSVVHLDVLYPPDNNPMIQQIPPIIAGNSVTLTCTVEGGNPLANLTWNCTGVASNNTAGIVASYSLTFNVTKMDNNKICSCSASHFISSYNPKKEITLNVYYAPDSGPSIHMMPAENLTVGVYVILTCSVFGGNPLANLSWNCTGNSSKTSTETTAIDSIGFSVDKSNNNMICSCSASHHLDTYKQDAQQKLVINFGPGKPVVEFTSELPWFEGNSTKLSCEYEEGNPKANIKWKNEHNNVQSNDDKKVFEFPSLTRDDNGMWITCTVHNQYANIESKKVYIDVQYFPSIMVEQTYILTNESKDVTILCNASGNPVPSIWWTLNRKNLTTSRINESVLFIGNINRTDSANYTCKATSISGKYGKLASIKDTHVDVNYAPDVTVTKDLPTLIENSNLTLLCNAAGKPQKYAYGWKHTFGRHVIRVITSNKNILQLKNVSYNDTGKYECFVNNGIEDRNGILNQTNSTDVEVQFKPLFVSYEKATTGKTGGNFSASVDFIAFPDIENTVTWRNSTDNSLLKNGSNMFMTLGQKNITTELYGIRVSFDKYGYTSSLNFPNFNEIQDGFYNLEVNNSAGVNSVTLRIVFSDRPEPPTSFSASVIGSTSVTLTWEEGFNGGNNQSFFIVYSKTNSEDNQSITIKEHSGTTYEVEVSDLLPSTSYFFQIKANNVEGDSDPVINNTIIVSTTYISEASPSIIGPVAGGVGGLAAAGFLVIGIFVFRRRQIASRKKTDRRNLTFTAQEEGDEEGLKDNELYVSAGEDFTDKSAATGDVYAVIRKPNEKKSKDTHIQETGLYAEVIKKNHQTKTEKGSTNLTTKQTGNPKKGKLKKEIDRNGDVYENMTKQVIKNTTENRNKDGLVYADLVFNDDGKRKFIIRGIDNRTDYADIDLDLKADPLPSDDSDEEDGKSTENVDLNKEK